MKNELDVAHKNVTSLANKISLKSKRNAGFYKLIEIYMKLVNEMVE